MSGTTTKVSIETVGVCVAVITTDCLILPFGIQCKLRRRDVVQILEHDKETFQIRVGLAAENVFFHSQNFGQSGMIAEFHRNGGGGLKQMIHNAATQTFMGKDQTLGQGCQARGAKKSNFHRPQMWTIVITKTQKPLQKIIFTPE
jgi:hypothetical protein